MKTIQQKIKVPFEYPVHFTHGVFHADNPLLADCVNCNTAKPSRVMLIIDEGIINADATFLSQIEAWFESYRQRVVQVRKPMIVTGGENAKNGWSSVREIMTCAGLAHLDRQSYVIAIGGGAVLDMSGFAASLVHRGLRFVRLPSTVLAQNDAGIGVKNGMNEGGAKNFAGTFAPPFAVINDLNLLKTLTLRDWISGCAEAFKVALIANRPFFEWLCDNSCRIPQREQPIMEELVYRTAKLHLDHIACSGDPFETGSARPLDFGHWAAHQLELLSNFTLSHGEGVAIGIALDCAYAMLENFISPADHQRIIEALRNCGLPVNSELLKRLDSNGAPAVFAGIEQFREHLGGELCITLPCPIGSKVEVHSLDTAKLKEALRITLQ